MALRLNREAEAVRDFAKRCVPEGRAMGMEVLLPALYFGAGLKERIPELAQYLPKPKEIRKTTPDSVPLGKSLKPVLNDLASQGGDPLTPIGWFMALLRSQAGREHLLATGASSEALEEALKQVEAGPGKAQVKAGADPGGWRGSDERKQVMDALGSFGRMLTVGESPQKGIVEMEKPLQSLFHALVQRKQHSPLIIGLPGTGKSALVYEFARLLVAGDPFVPERLRDHDIFELSPIFLRSGASHVGQYEERVSSLLRILTANPKVILFVDEAHSMFQSGMDHRGPFTDANEAFKQAIITGEISIIGSTTTAEFRHYIEPDGALKQRFTLVTIEEPSPEKTKQIMHARHPGIERYYGVGIPEDLIDRTVELAEEYLPDRAQPRKSIQLLDGACAYCVIQNPPQGKLTEQELWRALEDTIGHSVVREKALDPDEILEHLKSKIAGQDEVLKGISRAFVAGIKGWTDRAGKPRGTFLFSGPTGVGKTETAVLLSRILGGGKEALLRVDCNTLKGSGQDGGPAQNVLFGPPPGYIGYVRGKGGVLSQIRDNPECIVLFDEIEKADPNVGELLFRIIDDGQCEDKEGNPLDFRRSFIVFTTNAGAVYQHETTIGFEADGGSRLQGPATDRAAMRAHFARMGLGEAFLGRISHLFDFVGLDTAAARQILEIQFETFSDTVAGRGQFFEWEEGVLDYLVAEWQPELGARDVSGIFRNRVMEPLVVAQMRDELEGVETIRLEVSAVDSAGKEKSSEARAECIRRGNTLVIRLG